MATQITTPRWLKLTDAARHSSLSTRTLSRRLAEGVVSSKMVGYARLIDRESLDAWIESQPSAMTKFRGSRKDTEPPP